MQENTTPKEHLYALEQALRDKPIIARTDCPDCKTPQAFTQKDLLESAGGSGDFVTTLYACEHCRNKRAGETYWTSDY